MLYTGSPMKVYTVWDHRFNFYRIMPVIPRALCDKFYFMIIAFFSMSRICVLFTILFFVRVGIQDIELVTSDSAILIVDTYIVTQIRLRFSLDLRSHICTVFVRACERIF